MNKLALLLIVSLLIGACGTATRTGPTMKAKPFDFEVECFINPPKAEYVELGLVETDVIADSGESVKVGFAVETLKRLAAKLGANAVIVFPHETILKKSVREKNVLDADGNPITKYEYGVSVYYVVKGKAIHITNGK